MTPARKSRRPRPAKIGRHAPSPSPPHLLPIHLLLIVVCGAVVYANSLGGPFIFDDQTTVVSNASIRQLWPLAVPLSPPAETAMAGRPVANLTFAANYAVGGLDVRWYHAVNVVLHLLCALLVYAMLRRALRSPGLASWVSHSADGLALASTVIWAVHAANTEAVTYVTQRTELLAGLFYLLTLYCAIRAWGSVVPGRWVGASIGACALGMASKEMVVTAPVAVVLYDLAFSGGTLAGLWKKRKPLYLGLASTWLVLIALLSQDPRGPVVDVPGATTAVAYLLAQSISVITYLRLAVWPSPLVLAYGSVDPVVFGDVWPYALAVVVLLLAVAWAWARKPQLGYAGVWFFLVLAPTTSIVPIITEVTAERRMYLPLIAVVVLGVVASASGLRRFVARLVPADGEAALPRRMRFVGVSLVALASIGLGDLTLSRNAEFGTQVAIWQSVVDRRPEHATGHLSLGAALAMAGRSEEAIGSYRRGLALSPQQTEEFDARFNLGLELVKQQDWSEAIQHLRFCLDRNPAHPTANALIAEALSGQGFPEQAIEHYRVALAVNPSEPGATLAHFGLDRDSTLDMLRDSRLGLARSLAAMGDSSMGEGRYAAAVVHYREALGIAPDSPDVQFNLALGLASSDQPGEALVHARAAQQLLPTEPKIMQLLADVLLLNPELSETAAEEALELAMTAAESSRWQDAHILETLAGAYFDTGQPDLASQTLQRALEVTTDPATRERLQARLRGLQGISRP